MFFMKKSDLQKYEGKAVYFFHREGKTYPFPSRWTRGIVYRGICYDLSTRCKNREVPSINLEAVRTEYITEIHILERNQQTMLERSLYESFRNRLRRVTLRVKVVFDPWYEDREEEREKKLNLKVKNVRIPFYDTLPLPFS